MNFTKEQIETLKMTIGLLNSMIKCGENHSKTSTDFVNTSLEILRKYKEPEITYVLFGGAVCRAMLDDGIETALSIAKDEGYTICKFKDGDNLPNLLNIGSGWDDYTILTKKEYEQFFNI